MSQITQWFRNAGLRSIITLALVVLIAIPASGFYSNRGSEQAGSMTGQNSSGQAMIQKIQRDAEDLGDSPDRPIGQTGLKNIKNLGENIKETVDLNIKQKGAIYNPKESNKVEALKEAQEQSERAAK